MNNSDKILELLSTHSSPAMASALNPEAAAACREWLRNITPCRSVNRRRSSYGYKHSVERWGARNGHGAYVPMETFIEEAVRAGFQATLCDPRRTEPPFNCFFNFSERAVRRAELAENSRGHAA